MTLSPHDSDQQRPCVSRVRWQRHCGLPPVQPPFHCEEPGHGYQLASGCTACGMNYGRPAGPGQPATTEDRAEPQRRHSRVVPLTRRALRHPHERTIRQHRMIQRAAPPPPPAGNGSTIRAQRLDYCHSQAVARDVTHARLAQRATCSVAIVQWLS